MGVTEHFNDLWNVFDVTILIIAAITATIWVQIYIIHSESLAADLDLDSTGATQSGNTEELHVEATAETLINASQNIDLYHLGYYLVQYRDLQGILISLVIIKFLNYIEQINSKIGMLFQVLNIAYNEIIYFAIIFAVQFLCFVLMFKTAFGGNFHQFKSVGVSFTTLWRYLLNDYSSHGEVEAFNSLLAVPIMLYFVIETQFIFLNMIRAFISLAYF